MKEAMGADPPILARPRRRRDRIIALLFLGLAALILLVLPRGSLGLDSTFVLTSQRAGVNIEAPDLVVQTAPSLYVLGSLVAALAAWQWLRGFRRMGGALGTVSVLGIAAFLVWAAQDKSLNLTGMLVSSLVRATPIALAALSGIYSERSGVVNIGIEGMMLTGAFASVVFTSVSGSQLMGVAAGLAIGMVMAALHALLSIRFRVNQIVSGAGVIILALGLTSYLQRSVLNLYPELNQPGPSIAAVPIPGLWKIPVLGPLLFNQSPIIYALFGMLVLTQVLMYRTRWGLRVRSVGEHPRAADTLGINVFRTRYISVLLSGA
ncbi:MAG: ABC transporter permease, partial [Anaerolineales bacterium]